jgi:hypothetical protein
MLSAWVRVLFFNPETGCLKARFSAADFDDGSEEEWNEAEHGKKKNAFPRRS